VRDRDSIGGRRTDNPETAYSHALEPSIFEFGLDAFRNHFDAQVVAHLDHCPRDRLPRAPAFDFADQMHIDFITSGWTIRPAVQTRMPGAEIIDRELNAALPVLVDGLRKTRRIPDQLPFVTFEENPRSAIRRASGIERRTYGVRKCFETVRQN